MICNTCNSAIPDTDLVCPLCAQRKSDEAIRKSGLLRYRDGLAPLYLCAAAHRHVLPLHQAYIQTLCGERRFAVTVEALPHWNRTDTPPDRTPLLEQQCCPLCWKQIESALQQKHEQSNV